MTLPKFLIAIISSIWFIPVSCSFGLYAGTHYFSWSDSRDVLKGDQLHPLAYFVFEDPSNTDKFNYSLFKDLPQANVSTSSHSFEMSPDTDSISSGKHNSISYEVISKNASGQVIQTIFNDDDKTVWTTYKATSKDIVPIESKMMYFGYLFNAVPYVFIFVLLNYFGGRLIKKKSKIFRVD